MGIIQKATFWYLNPIMPMGTDQFLNQTLTLIFGWEIVDFVTMINQKSTSQPKINEKSTNCQPNFNHFSHWYFNFKLGWFLVEFWLRSWFLVDHCYKINDFSTKYQRWGWLRKVEAQRWINVDSMLRSWSVPTGKDLYQKFLCKVIMKSLKRNTHKIEKKNDKMAAMMPFRQPHWNYEDT